MPRREQGVYEVGYRKPPTATRFQKGRSGNPSGRPKGSKSLAPVFFKELYSTLTVEENGRILRKTKLDLILDRLALMAAAGDPKARNLVLAIHDAHYDPEMTEPVIAILPMSPR